MFREHGVRYALLDTLYATAAELRLPEFCERRSGHGSFEIWEARA
jgi:hypothetical protein